jgi:heme A synthase
MTPFHLFLALTIVATAAVYAACLIPPQQIGADENDDRSRPAH